MAAPKGNKNAEKWTFEKSKKLLERALELAEETDSFPIRAGKQIVYKNGYKYDFIGELACELDTYHSNITRDIPNRHPELKSLVNRLLSKLERNCYSNTKKENINTAVGIINLKSNHKWTDRVQNDTNLNATIETKPDLTKLSDDELRVLAEIQRKSGTSEA